MSLSNSAMLFAYEEFKDVRRKYTNEPYFGHLAEVVGITSTLLHLYHNSEELLCIAWAHDYVEDLRSPDDTTGEKAFATLSGKFGSNVSHGVWFLSNLAPKEFSRARRHQINCTQLSQAPSAIQGIKCADIISNTKSIAFHDPKFAKVYLPEKLDELRAMTSAPDSVLNLARQQCVKALESLA